MEEKEQEEKEEEEEKEKAEEVKEEEDEDKDNNKDYDNFASPQSNCSLNHTAGDRLLGIFNVVERSYPEGRMVCAYISKSKS